MSDLIRQYTVEIKQLMGRTAQNVVRIGACLQAVKRQMAHGTWEDWLEGEFGWSEQTAWRMMRVAERFKSSNLEELQIDLSSLYLLAAPSTPPAVAQEALEVAARGEVITLPRVQELLREAREVPPPLILTADPPPVQGGYRPTFNRTNEMVDWAKWTWNPLTGCLHNCLYCYARDIAERNEKNYPLGFAPHWRPERLPAPHYTKVPAAAAHDIGERNVFVCSMADLFGKWVEQEWIDAVLAEVRAAPQWNFLFLTKFPQRLAEIDWPRNAWVGTTVDEQYRVDIAEKAFRRVQAPVKWLSCEPLRERLTFGSLEMFDWVVLGGQSKSRQAPAFQPPWEWVEHLHAQARRAGCLIYYKPNLEARPQEYPTQGLRP
jgi:protein gp37